MATLIVSGLGLIGRRALLCLRAFLNGASIESSLYLLLSLMGVRNTTRLGLEILRASLACYRKTRELRLVEVDFRGQHNVLLVHLEKDMS